MNKYGIIFLLFILVPILGTAQDNPFLSRGEEEEVVEDTSEGNVFVSRGEENSTASSAAPVESGGVTIIPFLTDFMEFSRNFQKDLRDNMTTLAVDIKERQDYGAVFIILLFSFLYGIIHAIGPGHGKMIFSSYFISTDAKPAQGFIAGFLMAVIHASSASILVIVLFFIIKQFVLANFDDAQGVIQMISLGAIAAIGLFMLVKNIISAVKKKHSHSHKIEEALEKKADGKGIFFIAFASGIVPCPGAAMVLFFLLSMDLMGIGLLAVLAMSVGMALTISAIGVFVILARNGILKAFNKADSIREKIHTATEIGGSALLFLMGSLFFVSVL